MFKLHAFSRF